VFVTGSLQPYAIDFYRALDRSLKELGWRFQVIVGNRSTYRPWTSMGISEDDPLFSFLTGQSAPEWVQRLLGSAFRDKILLPGGSGVTAALEADRPDILILNERNPLNLIAAWWAKRRRVPCILSTDIGIKPPSFAATAAHFRYHRAIRGLFDGVIAKTPDAMTAFAKRGAPEPVLAPHGIDTARFPTAELAEKSEPFRFLFVGMMEPMKGLDALAEAGRLMHAKGHRFEIRLVGTGPWQPSAADVDAGWLSLAGFRERGELLGEYHSARAFILPSHGDTYGVVVHEAASCGLPVFVSHASGACHTLAIEGVSGFRIDPAKPAEMSEMMIALLEDRELERVLAKGARDLALRWCTVQSGQRVATWLQQFHRPRA
jgi:glycosyltransferase involved in cell wall biosynthesis